MMSHWAGDNNPGHKRRMRLWQQIEHEFDEPIADVIVGLREQGNSWRTVAGCLDVSRGTLQEWRKLLGLKLDKNDNVFDESSLPELSPLDHKAIELGYKNKVDAIIDLRMGQKKTIKEAAAILKCHYQTISLYSPMEVKYTYNVSKIGAAKRIKNLKLARKGFIEKQRENPGWHPFAKDNGILFGIYP